MVHISMRVCWGFKKNDGTICCHVLWQAAWMFGVVSDSHWPAPAECGPLCRFGPCRGQRPPRCHTVCQSSGPRRWPSDSPHLCAHKHTLTLRAGVYWLPLPSPHHTVTFCVRRQNSFPSAFQTNSLFSLFLPPSSLCFPSSPCFLSYSPSLIPICCLIILALPHTALSPAPSLPSFHNPQSFSQRTSTDHPPRERFRSVSSEILPDLLVQVIVSIPLRGS